MNTVLTDAQKATVLRHTLIWTALACSTLLAGCEKKQPDAAAAAASAASAAPGTGTGTGTGMAANGPTPATPTPATKTLDVGKLESVQVTADGHGATASDAVAEAMRLALLQVNGASIDVATVNAKFGLDVTLNQDAASLRAAAFADVVRQRSGGVIQNFRITDMSEPLLPKGKYKASITANIAKFNAPAELTKIKLVVAPLRFDKATLPMGDRSVPAAEVGAELRQRILDALVNTGRFAVLDRDVSPELQQELDMIAGGASPRAEVAKLSQAATADLLWIGKINTLAYNRHARQLRTSDRELVSYSGGWSVSQKLVNVATRQVVASETLKGDAAPTAATTLGTGVDSRRVQDSMTSELVSSVVASVLNRTFPITVVALDGANVVLSQGGQALRPGARYAMVAMGAEMKDPQTGQSLGRLESPCCQLVVDRVTPNLSYGHLENVQGALDQLAPGALQVREPLKASAKADAVADAGTAATPVHTSKAARAARDVTDAAPPPAAVPATPTKDDKW